MFRIYAALVRTTYLVAVLVALAFVAPWAFASLSAFLLLGLLIAPAARALYRLVRHRQLIPDANLREAPIVATLVCISSVLASFLLLYLHWALLIRAGRDIEVAPLGFFGLIWLALALLIAEVVLVGRKKRGTDLFVDDNHVTRDSGPITNK